MNKQDEAAVYCAMKIADQLPPASSAFAALRARLAGAGQVDLSYDS